MPTIVGTKGDPIIVRKDGEDCTTYALTDILLLQEFDHVPEGQEHLARAAHDKGHAVVGATGDGDGLGIVPTLLGVWILAAEESVN